MALQQYESRRVFERLGGSLMVVDVTVEIRAGQEQHDRCARRLACAPLD